METQKEKLLRLWKARQEAEGYDVSGVTTLKEAEHFFEKKVEPEEPEQTLTPEAPVEPEEPEAEEAPVEPEEKKPRKTKKAKGV